MSLTQLTMTHTVLFYHVNTLACKFSAGDVLCFHPTANPQILTLDQKVGPEVNHTGSGTPRHGLESRLCLFGQELYLTALTENLIFCSLSKVKPSFSSHKWKEEEHLVGWLVRSGWHFGIWSLDYGTAWQPASRESFTGRIGRMGVPGMCIIPAALALSVG